MKDSLVNTTNQSSRIGHNIKCKYCLQSFNTKDTLKRHILDHHGYEYKCQYCDQRYGNSYDLELHLISDHKKEKSFECNICEAKFIVEWRLKKHITTHQNTNQLRTCHYFNNGKVCPYKEHGCKFLHIEAVKCRFVDSCKKN